MSVLCNCRFKCSRLFSNLESFSQLLLTFKPTDVAFKIDFSKLWYSKKILVHLKSYFLWQYKSQLVSSYRQVLVVPFPPLYCRKLFSQNWSWKVQKRPKRPQREENKFCPSHSNTHAWARRKIILALTHLMWIPPHKLPISITLSLSYKLSYSASVQQRLFFFMTLSPSSTQLWADSFEPTSQGRKQGARKPVHKMLFI